MRVLVCGGRDYQDEFRLHSFLDEFRLENEVDLIIEGGAKGADSFARNWADMYYIPCLEHPANWPRDGKSAGPIRNSAMLRLYKPHVVIAFPGGKGTAHMVRIAKEAGVKVIEVNDET